MKPIANHRFLGIQRKRQVAHELIAGETLPPATLCPSGSARSRFDSGWR
jgi:hypothetical protein